MIKMLCIVLATVVAVCCAAPVAEPNYGFYGVPTAYSFGSTGAYPYGGFPTAYSAAGFGAANFYSGGYAPVSSAYGAAFPLTFL